MLKIGHRGACGHKPENTILSFSTAVDLGADAIEFDVRSCKDGILVVIHDETVNRTTNGKGKVKDFTMEELRQLDAGEKEKIPTLEEVLKNFGNQVICNVELKEGGIAGKVLEVARRCGCLESIILSAFSRQESSSESGTSWNEILQLKVGEKDLKIGLLAGHAFIKDALSVAIASRSLPVYSLNLPVAGLNHALVKEIRQATDCKVLAWSTNDPNTIKRLKKMGVDGIFSDYPDRL